jgi:hypothetical protein
MARSEGFEPSAFWSVARRSIQLSYERAIGQALSMYRRGPWESMRRLSFSVARRAGI